MYRNAKMLFSKISEQHDKKLLQHWNNYTRTRLIRNKNSNITAVSN